MSDLIKKLRKLESSREINWRECSQAADLIEQLQQRNAELKSDIDTRKHAFNVLSTTCARLADENSELAATVERLRGVMTKFERSYEEIEYDGNVGMFFESDALDELSDVLEATPQQNLNALKREVAESAIKTSLRNLGNPDIDEQDIDEFANGYCTRYYPTEGE